MRMFYTERSINIILSDQYEPNQINAEKVKLQNINWIFLRKIILFCSEKLNIISSIILKEKWSLPLLLS
jgi:hypothetical protein